MNWTIDYIYCRFLRPSYYRFFHRWINEDTIIHRDKYNDVSEMRILIEENGWEGKLYASGVKDELDY